MTGSVCEILSDVLGTVSEVATLWPSPPERLNHVRSNSFALRNCSNSTLFVVVFIDDAQAKTLTNTSSIRWSPSHTLKNETIFPGWSTLDDTIEMPLGGTVGRLAPWLGGAALLAALVGSQLYNRFAKKQSNETKDDDTKSGTKDEPQGDPGVDGTEEKMASVTPKEEPQTKQENKKVSHQSTPRLRRNLGNPLVAHTIERFLAATADRQEQLRVLKQGHKILFGPDRPSRQNHQKMIQVTKAMLDLLDQTEDLPDKDRKAMILGALAFWERARALDNNMAEPKLQQRMWALLDK